MKPRLRRIPLLAFLLSVPLFSGCVPHADTAILTPRAPDIHLLSEAPHSVFVEVRNGTAVDFHLHSPLIAALQRKGYSLAQERGTAGYALNVHLRELTSGTLPEAEDPDERTYGASSPVLGMGIGSLSGRTGVGIGLSMGIPLNTGSGLFFSRRNGYAATAVLEVEESIGAARRTQRTSLTVTAGGRSETEALPLLEDKLAARISDLFP